MTTQEINSLAKEGFLRYIERLKVEKGLSEYCIMKNVQKHQPKVPRNIITQIRNNDKRISLELCVLIGASNDYPFII